jgi:hypothetical protein
MREDKTHKFRIIKEDIMFRFPKPALTAGAATHRLAGNQANRLENAHFADPTRSPLRRELMNVKILQVAVLMLPMSGSSDNLSPGMGTGSGPGWLSFRRIVDIPFETCVAALESWREGRNDELQLGQSTLRGPIEHDHGSGTCRVEVRLARGPLRPPLRMRLDLDCWSRSSSTALELIPCGHVRATASYFRAGHLLLDSLTHSLQLKQEIHALELPPHGKPCGYAPNSNPGKRHQPADNSCSSATRHTIAQIALTPRSARTAATAAEPPRPLADAQTAD